MPSVLVIDDDPVIAEIVRSVVPDWNVTSTLDGVAGVDEVRRHLAQGHPPELVVLDVDLPDLDGYDVGILLRAAAPTLPIIPFTNLRTDHRLPSYMAELGCTFPLYKGASPQQLLTTLQAALEQPVAPLAQEAVFDRLLQKAVQAEVQARTNRSAHTRVRLFATRLISLLGMQRLLEQQPRLIITNTALEVAQLRIELPEADVDLVVVSAADFPIAHQAIQPYRTPTLIIGDLEECRAIAHAVTEFVHVLPLGLLAADATFAQQLAPAIEALIQKRASYVDPRLQPAAIDQLIVRVSAGGLDQTLSPRQTELVLLDLYGWTTPQIAARFGVTRATILTYWKRIYVLLECDRHGVRQWASARLRERPDLVRELTNLSTIFDGSSSG